MYSWWITSDNIQNYSLAIIDHIYEKKQNKLLNIQQH